MLDWHGDRNHQSSVFRSARIGDVVSGKGSRNFIPQGFGNSSGAGGLRGYLADDIIGPNGSLRLGGRQDLGFYPVDHPIAVGNQAAFLIEKSCPLGLRVREKLQNLAGISRIHGRHRLSHRRRLIDDGGDQFTLRGQAVHPSADQTLAQFIQHQGTANHDGQTQHIQHDDESPQTGAW